MIWPFGKTASAPELRSDNYAGLITDSLLLQASGKTISASALAAVEAVARLFEDTLGIATASAAGDLITPTFLRRLGRDLALRGESLFVIDVSRRGAVSLTPAHCWDITGGIAPETWVYRCDLAGPMGSATVTRPAQSVIHLITGVDATQPWRGRSAFDIARQTSTLLKNIEISLSGEAALPTARIAPLPSPDVKERTAYGVALRKGGVVVPQAADLQPHTGGQEPASRWEPQKLGADPSAALVSLREQVRADIFGAAGVPTGLLDSTGTPNGVASREALRQFLHLRLAPLGRLIAAELTDKLDRDISLTFEDLFAGDLQGRARSFQAMVTGGMDVDKATALSGLMVPADEGES